MIKYLTKKIILYCVKNGLINQNSISIYEYGLELWISSIINFSLIFLVAIVTNTIYCGLAYLLSFVPLRLATGGFHAKNHLTCILITNLQYLFVWQIINRVNSEIMILFIIIIGFISIYFLSPLEAKNKPISNIQKRRLRKKSIFLFMIDSFIVIICLNICKNTFMQDIAEYFISGVLSSSILLIMGYFEMSKNK